MSTANYVVVSLGDKELSTEGGIAVKGLYTKLLSIKLICGFIVFTDILLNGVRKQATPVQVSLDEENKFHVSNLYGYDLVIDNADLVVASEHNSGTKLYLHTITDSNLTLKLITTSDSQLDFSILDSQEKINTYLTTINVISFTDNNNSQLAFDNNPGSKYFCRFYVEDGALSLVGLDDWTLTTSIDTVTPL